MDAAHAIPMIDIDVPRGWQVTASAGWWQAVSPGRTMYIVITHDDEQYRSTLYRYVDDVSIIDIRAPGLDIVIPNIKRFMELASLSEPPDTLSPLPDNSIN